MTTQISEGDLGTVFENLAFPFFFYFSSLLSYRSVGVTDLMGSLSSRVNKVITGTGWLTWATYLISLPIQTSVTVCVLLTTSLRLSANTDPNSTL